MLPWVLSFLHPYRGRLALFSVLLLIRKRSLISQLSLIFMMEAVLILPL